MTILPSSPTVKGFTANILRGSVRYLRRPLAAARAPDHTRLRDDGLLNGSLGGRCGARRLAQRRILVLGEPGVLLDGLLVSLRRKGSVETDLPYCLTARSRRLGGWFDCDEPGLLPNDSLGVLRRMVGSRRAQRLARQLARGPSADGFDRGGPSVLPDGSLAALRQMVRFKPCLAC